MNLEAKEATNRLTPTKRLRFFCKTTEKETKTLSSAVVKFTDRKNKFMTKTEKNEFSTKRKNSILHRIVRCEFTSRTTYIPLRIVIQK